MLMYVWCVAGLLIRFRRTVNFSEVDLPTFQILLFVQKKNDCDALSKCNIIVLLLLSQLIQFKRIVSFSGTGGCFRKCQTWPCSGPTQFILPSQVENLFFFSLFIRFSHFPNHLNSHPVFQPYSFLHKRRESHTN